MPTAAMPGPNKPARNKTSNDRKQAHPNRCLLQRSRRRSCSAPAPLTDAGATTFFFPRLFFIQKKCKQHQDLHKTLQEKEGDAVGLVVRQQTKWISRMFPIMGNSVLKALHKKSDTHVLQILLEHKDKRPHFKIRDFMVLSLATVAQEGPSVHQQLVTDLQGAKSAAGVDGSYGLVMFACYNWKLPLVSNIACTREVSDFTNTQTIDEILHLINQGRF
eukprot:gene8742-33602_t